MGKQLRYTIEMFIDCFGPALRTTLYPAIAQMQQVLGDVNDHFNAVQLYATLGTKLGVFLSAHGRRYQPIVDRLKAQRETQLQEGCLQFQLWWENWQKPEIQVAIGDLLSSAPATWHVLYEAESPIAGPRNELPAASTLNAIRTA